MINKNSLISIPKESFFKQFSDKQIFESWDSSLTLLELAQALGFNNPKGLARVDYEYMEALKNRDKLEQKVISMSRKTQKTRYQYIANLSADQLNTAMNYEGVETLSHLALHFLVSPKHGRESIRSRIKSLNLDVKLKLHKGVFGVSSTPQFWPTKAYAEKNA